ncbi:MAG: EamA family transporter [Clostridiales bacterium]|nr:EamA family transporter [Clostridiales bacterium]
MPYSISALIMYIVSLLLFGSNGIVADKISLSSVSIVLLRTLIGSLLLILLFVVSGHKFTFTKYPKDLIYIIISGIAMGISWMLLYEAYAQIGVSTASLLYYCGPVIVMALSPLLYGERLTWSKLCGFAVVFVGIVLVNGSIDTGGGVLGFILGGASAIMYAVMVTTNRRAKNITGMENSLVQLCVSFLTVAVFVLSRAFISGGFAESIKLGFDGILWMLLLGMVNTGLGCYLYFSSIGRLPMQTAAVCGYLEPLSAVIFSVIFLGENLTLTRTLGVVMIIGGALFCECIHTKKKA